MTNPDSASSESASPASFATGPEFSMTSHPMKLWEAQVESRPDAIALVRGRDQMSYVELDKRASAFAGYLREFGIATEDVVAVCLGRGFDAIVGLLGVLKAQGVYLPLDPSLPPNRLTYMLTDSQAKLLVVAPTIDVSWQTARYAIVHYDQESIGVAGSALEVRGTSVNMLGLAYVTYTSGSTGAPKGIALTWQTLWNLVRFEIHRDHLLGEAPPTCTQLASAGFDVSLQEILVTLLRGGKLVLVDEDDRLDSDRLLDIVEREHVDRIYISPALLEHVVPSWGTRPPGNCSLTHLLVSGDRLTLNAESRNALARLGVVVLENQYGPSETHLASAFYMSGDPTAWPDSPAIGRAVHGVQIYVLDDLLNLVPPRVSGEVYIASEGMGRGYLNKPGLTAERFVADPFGSGARLYRTGDVGRWSADGVLEFLGRADSQVKIRGFRIEPAEIEVCLASHQAVRAAVVVANRDPSNELWLAAYVVPLKRGETPSQADLKGYLRRQLPEYMIPEQISFLRSLPMSANGKVDRRSLTPLSRSYQVGDVYVPAVTEIQRKIAEIWEQLLGIERVGIDDDFFHLGGHSLAATRIVSYMRSKIDSSVSVRDLFQDRTVRNLAARLDTRIITPHTPSIIPRSGRSSQPSFGQRRMWFFDQLVPDSSVYNVSSNWAITGEVDAEVLAHALRTICERHQVLTTRFESSADATIQVASGGAVPDLTVEDLRHLQDPSAESMKRSHELGSSPYDLATGPLLRAQLFQLASRSYHFAMHFHHIVVDGWSLHLFWNEIAALYDAETSSRPTLPPPLHIQYSDYATWQRTWMDSPAAQEQLDFWKKLLKDAPEELELPTDRPRPGMPSGQGNTIDFHIPTRTAETLNSLGRENGATPYMVFLTLTHILLSKYAGTSDIVTGSPVSGRTRPETDTLIGFFANTIAIRLKWDGDPSFTELLAQAREIVVEAQQNQELPFDRVVEEIAPARVLSRNPVFQVLFTLSDASTYAAPAGWLLQHISVCETHSRFDLEIQMQRTPTEMKGSVCYSIDLFDEGTINQLINHLVNLCKAAALRPDAPVSQLDILGPDEHKRILGEWNEFYEGAAAADDE